MAITDALKKLFGKQPKENDALRKAAPKHCNAGEQCTDTQSEVIKPARQTANRLKSMTSFDAPPPPPDKLGGHLNATHTGELKSLGTTDDKSARSESLKASYSRLAAYVQTLPEHQKQQAVKTLPKNEGAEIVRSIVADTSTKV
jgi:polyribonucleotide nucleotidyltransferase